MLEFIDATGGWGPTTIVEGLSLKVAIGEVIGIIGRNGVGKTTLLELASGRATLNHGDIRLKGKSLAQLPPHKRNHLGLAHVPQNREVFGSLRVEEHLRIAVRPGPWTSDRIIRLFPSLGRRMASVARNLSGGEQQMLAIARAMLNNPSVIMMDEPSEGLAPVVIEQMIGAISSLAREGSIGLLLVEQRLDIALELASKCLVMERGKIVREVASNEAESPDDFAEIMGLH